jgi:hypothetical protein
MIPARSAEIVAKAADLPPDVVRSLTHLATTTPWGLYRDYIPLAWALQTKAARMEIPLAPEDLLGLITNAVECAGTMGPGWEAVCRYADALLAVYGYHGEKRWQLPAS